MSEEIQIKGRTARHGEMGSYSMILSLRDLEKYLIRPEDLAKHNDDMYNFLNEKRNTYFNLQYAENTKYVENIKTFPSLKPDICLLTSVCQFYKFVKLSLASKLPKKLASLWTKFFKMVKIY